MQLSYETVAAVLTRLGDDAWEWCGQYGEPGYSMPADATTPLVVLGSYWCRCSKFEPDDPHPLHAMDKHHPRLWRQLEAQGVEFAWYDEWTIDYETDKAYRTTSDSYMWQPSLVITEGGDYLTPDNDIDAWIEWAIEEVKAIPDNVWSHHDIRMAGFEQINEHSYESGWHPHQTDDPVKILAEMRERYPDDQLIFTWDEQSQFYAKFSIWRRPANDRQDA